MSTIEGYNRGKAQKAAEKLRVVAAALAVNHHQRKCREKAQPCTHMLSSFQLCSREGHLLAAVLSYFSSCWGLTAPAELLLELTLAGLGQNASTAASQVCANPAGSGGKCGQARGKQAIPPAQGEVTGSWGQDRNSFLPTHSQRSEKDAASGLCVLTIKVCHLAGSHQK